MYCVGLAECVTFVVRGGPFTSMIIRACSKDEVGVESESGHPMRMVFESV